MLGVEQDHARGSADAERAHGTSSRSARNQRSRSSHGTAAFAGDVDGSTKSSVSPNRPSCSPCGGRPAHGLQERRLGEALLYVLPSTSPANAAVHWEERLHWFRALRDLVP